MDLIVSIDESAHERALATARGVGAQGASRVDGLPTVLRDQVTSWIDRIWDQVEQAIRDAYSQGRAAAQSAIDAVTTEIKAAASELGDSLALVETEIRRRLDEYFQSLIDGALARVRSTIRIGDRGLVANGATIQQTIRFTGSLKTRLDDICSFVAESQLAVSVSYGVEAVQSTSVAT